MKYQGLWMKATITFPDGQDTSEREIALVHEQVEKGIQKILDKLKLQASVVIELGAAGIIKDPAPDPQVGG